MPAGKNGHTRIATAADPDIAALKQEVARLQTENQTLKNQLAFVQPGTPPDDFASAVQHALDKLQTQLYTMTNPVSNFAVKEFHLEANVWMSVTPLGMVEYRFVVPGEKVDASSLTKVTLDLVPLAKSGEANSYTTADFQPGLGIDGIEGLTAPQRKNLHAQGIDTVADFLSVGTRSRTSLQLETVLGVTRARFAGLLAAAQLLTLKGIDGGRATVLVSAGIDSFAKLAALAPEQLMERFNQQRLKMKREDVKPLEAAESASLIRAAKAFCGADLSPARSS